MPEPTEREAILIAALDRIAKKSCVGGANCSDLYGDAHREARAGHECVHHIARSAMADATPRQHVPRCHGPAMPPGHGAECGPVMPK